MENQYVLNLENTEVYKNFRKKCEQNSQHDLVALVSEIASFSIERLKTVIKNMPEFTLHDETHIYNMLRIMDRIIPESTIEHLSIPDLLMLILSVLLHDIGMAPEEKYILAWKTQIIASEEDEELRKESEVFQRFRMTFTHQLADIERLHKQEEHSKAQLLEDYIITEYIRTTHSSRAKQIIADYWDGKITYQDTDLTEDLASICFSHNENYTYLLNMEAFRLCGQDTYLCLPFVAVMLRIADIIDFDPKRTPSILFSHLAVRNPVSIAEWRKHQSINAWSISSKN